MKNCITENLEERSEKIILILRKHCFSQAMIDKMAEKGDGRMLKMKKGENISKD